MSGANRAEFKAACLALLDRLCIEHPAGHQSKLAARYILISRSGERIPIMFEKAPNVAAQLWLRAEHTRHLGKGLGETRSYPAHALYTEKDEKGRPIYGRHAALKAMRDMANADLVKLEIEWIGQLERVIGAILDT
ncbi:hypothetical protein [Paragemmobacter straminiformis]|uniref:Uncharacterized protein n=1 Tax=Paragemmobacter straminiformis TaxID=2045119 RepID=A0A842I2W1_9RHOB|nr:hypothetical protein [Gemmobacter straminiformis]MBC2834069.1 hypothetical protein [Gemmobacter straminiformis]